MADCQFGDRTRWKISRSGIQKRTDWKWVSLLEMGMPFPVWYGTGKLGTYVCTYNKSLPYPESCRMTQREVIHDRNQEVGKRMILRKFWHHWSAYDVAHTVGFTKKENIVDSLIPT